MNLIYFLYPEKDSEYHQEYVTEKDMTENSNDELDEQEQS